MSLSPTSSESPREIQGLSDFRPGDSDTPFALVLTMFRVAYLAKREMIQEVEQHQGLSPTALRLLMSVRLADGGPLNLGVLAGELAMTKANVSRELQRLEESGMVVRSADPDDRRRIRARTAPHVDELLRNAWIQGNATTEATFAPLSRPECQRLRELTEAIEHALGDQQYPDLAEGSINEVQRRLMPTVNLEVGRASLALARASLGLRKDLERCTEPSGLTFVAFHALACVILIDGGNLELDALVTQLGVNRGNVSWLLQGLDSKGLIIREPSPDDRRRIRVRATPAGVALATVHIPSLRSECAAALAPLSAADRSELAGLLDRVEAHVGER